MLKRIFYLIQIPPRIFYHLLIYSWIYRGNLQVITMAAAQTSPAATLVDVLTKPWSLDQTDSYMSTFVPLSYKVRFWLISLQISNSKLFKVWKCINFQIMIGYLVTIYFGQKLMAHRKPFDLQNTLALWNFGFSLFSGIAAYKLIPELFGVFMKDGFVGKILSWTLQAYIKYSIFSFLLSKRELLHRCINWILGLGLCDVESSRTRGYYVLGPS